MHFDSCGKLNLFFLGYFCILVTNVGNVWGVRHLLSRVFNLMQESVQIAYCRAFINMQFNSVNFIGDIFSDTFCVCTI